MPEFLQAGDVRIAFEREGRGPLLLLMHGAEANRQMFGALWPLLTPHFTVVAYDQRDCGDTEASPRAATLAELAGDAAALIHSLGHERAHVFGSSFGGRVAQALALLYPDRVDHLALGSTWPLPLRHAALDPEGAARIAELRACLPDSAEALAGWFFPESFLQTRPDLRQLFAAARSDTERAHRRRQTVAGTLELEAAAIRVPVLVMTGDRDRVVPPQATMRIADAIAHSRRKMLTGVGHAAVLQAPEQVAAALIDFLTRKEASRVEPH
jgi:pimeloyl-ACP methyl ester carboxylesterase